MKTSGVAIGASRVDNTRRQTSTWRMAEGRVKDGSERGGSTMSIRSRRLSGGVDTFSLEDVELQLFLRSCRVLESLWTAGELRRRP